MPEHAAEQFERSIHELDMVVDELIGTRRRDRILISGVIIAVLAGGVTTAYVLDEQHDQQVFACRESNIRFDGLMGILDRSVTSEAGRALVEQMRGVSIVDCDDDGEIDDDLPGQRT